MKTPAHMTVGAVVAAAPDVWLLLFAWRRRRVPDDHVLMRAHRAFHHPASPAAAAVVGAVLFAAAWGSHVATDAVSPHPLPRWVER